MKQDTIVVFDYGSQYTRLISRRLREINVFCDLVYPEIDKSFFDERNIKGFEEAGNKCSDGVYANNKKRKEVRCKQTYFLKAPKRPRTHPRGKETPKCEFSRSGELTKSCFDQFHDKISKQSRLRTNNVVEPEILQFRENPEKHAGRRSRHIDLLRPDPSENSCRSHRRQCVGKGSQLIWSRESPIP